MASSASKPADRKPRPGSAPCSCEPFIRPCSISDVWTKRHELPMILTRIFLARARAGIEFGKTPDLAKLETGLQQFSESSQKALYTFWGTLSEVQLSLVDFFRGNWASALSHAHASCGLKRE